MKFWKLFVGNECVADLKWTRLLKFCMSVHKCWWCFNKSFFDVYLCLIYHCLPFSSFSHFSWLILNGEKRGNEADGRKKQAYMGKLRYKTLVAFSKLRIFIFPVLLGVGFSILLTSVLATPNHSYLVPHYTPSVLYIVTVYFLLAMF